MKQNIEPATASGPKCSNTDHIGRKAVMYCSKCDEYFCSECEAFHDRALARHAKCVTKDFSHVPVTPHKSLKNVLFTVMR